MRTYQSISRLGVMALVGLSLTSCAMWPTLKPDSELKPATATDIECRTSSFDTAYACAFSAHAELTALIDGVGDYNRSSSYAAWVLGTATGGVLAFDGGESVLKGLAVGAGGLIGLNSIVKTDQQIQAVSRAKSQLSCAMSVAQQIHESANSQAMANLKTSSLAAVRTIDSERAKALAVEIDKKNTLLGVESAMAKYRAASEDIQFKSIAKASTAVASSVSSADAGIGLKLSNAVFTIRDQLRAELAGMVVNDEKAMMDQRNHVVDMAGEVIRKRAEVRKLKDGAPVSSDTGQAEIAEVAQQALNGSAGIEDAFKECVDPSTAAALSS